MFGDKRLNRRPQKSSSQQNCLRIIGGQWRGRKLDFPDAEGLRPTPDRVRETLFNWLQGHVVDARCLDLFAGSGALGLEALSRGAARAVLVDSNSSVSQQLEKNLRTLQCDAGVVSTLPAKQFLQRGVIVDLLSRHPTGMKIAPFAKRYQTLSIRPQRTRFGMGRLDALVGEK